MKLARESALVLPLAGLLLAGQALTVACLRAADGGPSWYGLRSGRVTAAGVFTPVLVALVAATAVAFATLVLARDDQSRVKRLLGALIALVLGCLVSPLFALAMLATAALAAWQRRARLGAWLGLPLGLCVTAAALTGGHLAARALVDGSGLLTTLVPRPERSPTLVAPNWEVQLGVVLLLAWGLAAACMGYGTLARRLGAVLAGLVIVTAGPLLLHDAPWTFTFGGSRNALDHLSFLVVLIGGVRAVTGWDGLRDGARREHLAGCGLLLVAGLLLGPGEAALGAIVCAVLHVVGVPRRGARDRDDLRWRHARHVGAAAHLGPTEQPRAGDDKGE